MEGARWDGGAGCIDESAIGETHVPMPVIWLDPLIKVRSDNALPALNLLSNFEFRPVRN
jgi:hypothetical protein